ncbi:MAG TPA: protein-disulfide reductase DsbD domain-containing protein [Blastocatellia bacterium]|nr:protein-disulfide reductase DsbD domain-containing protein [Blastocatellia bacterium]
MKLRKMMLHFFMVAAMAVTVVAQGTGKVVKVSAGESVYKIKKGAAAEISVVVEIDNGYHINSNRPAEDFLIPTALKLERLAGITTTRIVYPKAKVQKFEFSQKPMSVFEGKAVIKFTARSTPAAATGAHTLKAKVTVQACDDKQCLRPQTLSLDIPIEVVN